MSLKSLGWGWSRFGRKCLRICLILCKQNIHLEICIDPCPAKRHTCRVGGQIFLINQRLLFSPLLLWIMTAERSNSTSTMSIYVPVLDLHMELNSFLFLRPFPNLLFGHHAHSLWWNLFNFGTLCFYVSKKKGGKPWIMSILAVFIWRPGEACRKTELFVILQAWVVEFLWQEIYVQNPQPKAPHQMCVQYMKGRQREHCRERKELPRKRKHIACPRLACPLSTLCGINDAAGKVPMS